MRSRICIASLLIILVLCTFGKGYAQQDIWSILVSDEVRTVCSPQDVNGDSTPDVIAGSYDNNVYCLSGTDGSEIWKFTAEDSVETAANMGDLDDDEICDVVIGSASLEIINNNIFCLSGSDGSVLWQKDLTNDGIYYISRGEDYNSDGKSDVLLTTEGTEAFCLSGADGAQLWMLTLQDRGLQINKCPDLNNDSIGDILVFGDDFDKRIHCVAGNSLGDATVIWSHQFGKKIRSVESIEDLDGDMTPEFIAGGKGNIVYCLSGETGSILWEHATDSEVFSVIPISDLDGDGISEAVFGNKGANLVCLATLDATPSILWSATAPERIRGVMAINDMDNDTLPDVVAFGGDTEGFLMGVSSAQTTASRTLWTKSCAGPIREIAPLSAITLSGDTTIAFGSQASEIYCVKSLAGATNVDEWQFY